MLYSAYMLRQFRLSVCRSVRTSVTRVDCIKTANISKFLQYLIGTLFLFFVNNGCCVNLTASPISGAPNIHRGIHFRPICSCISETVIDKGMEDEYKVVCVHRIVPPSMTLSDLESQFQGHSIVQYYSI